MTKLLLVGDPKGVHSKSALKKYEPEDIWVWENDSRHIYTINQISPKINVINNLKCFPDNMKFFSQAIANPPYIKNLHLEFLRDQLKISDVVTQIHPAGWLFRNGKNIEKEVKDMLKGRIKSLTFLNGNAVFNGAEFDCPLVITHATRSYNEPIELFYKSSGNKYYVNDLSEIPTGFWEPKDIHKSIVEKYKELTKNTCLNDIAGKYKGGSFVQPPRTCGHAMSKDPDKFCTNDFYTFFYRKSDIWTLKPKEPCYNVNNNKEGESLVSFMKTKFARFGLSIHKISRDSYLSRYLSNVPLPPLDREWTESSIMEYYSMTSEHIKYINNFIPDYYVQEE